MAEKKENFEKMRREVEDSKTRLEQDEHQLIRTENKIAKLGKIDVRRRTFFGKAFLIQNGIET